MSVSDGLSQNGGDGNDDARVTLQVGGQPYCFERVTAKLEETQMRGNRTHVTEPDVV